MRAAPKRYEVVLTEGAAQDLEALYDYMAQFDRIQNANHVLDRLMAIVEDLSEFPERGSHPRDLLALGIRAYRQVLFKPYRAIYRVVNDNQVVIHLIVDGRRNMQSMLARRLLGA